MGGSRNQFVVLAVVAFFGLVLYFAIGRNDAEHEDAKTKQTEFAGYACTVDCSGHEAGYKWAKEHNISDGEECDRAGENSNSPSFAEGCHAYVDGDPDPEDAADPDNEN